MAVTQTSPAVGRTPLKPAGTAPRGLGRTSRVDTWIVLADRDGGLPRGIRPVRALLGLRLGPRLRGAGYEADGYLSPFFSPLLGVGVLPGLAVAGDPRPVDPARVPDHLLRVPAGLLPVVLRRSARLRGG